MGDPSGIAALTIRIFLTTTTRFHLRPAETQVPANADFCWIRGGIGPHAMVLATGYFFSVEKASSRNPFNRYDNAIVSCGYTIEFSSGKTQIRLWLIAISILMVAAAISMLSLVILLLLLSPLASLQCFVGHCYCCCLLSLSKSRQVTIATVWMSLLLWLAVIITVDAFLWSLAIGSHHPSAVGATWLLKWYLFSCCLY